VNLRELLIVLGGMFFIAVSYALGYLQGRAERVRPRRDEASQFDVGDVVTFGDGSWLVVASHPPHPSPATSEGQNDA
jgi:hypothetical protein